MTVVVDVAAATGVTVTAGDVLPLNSLVSPRYCAVMVLAPAAKPAVAVYVATPLLLRFAVPT